MSIFNNTALEPRFLEAVESIAKSLAALANPEKESVMTGPSEPAPMKVTWGHGHVYPRIDGSKARCGGPALCRECAGDQAEFNAQKEHRSNG